MEDAAMDGEAYGEVYQQRVIPLLLDVAATIKDPKNAGETLYTGDALDGNLTKRALWFALNELGGITIMFPEDY